MQLKQVQDLAKCVAKEYEARALGKEPGKIKEAIKEICGTGDYDELYRIGKQNGFCVFIDDDHSSLIGRITKNGQAKAEKPYDWQVVQVQSSELQGTFFYEDTNVAPMSRLSSFCTKKDIIVIADPLQAKWNMLCQMTEAPLEPSERAFYTAAVGKKNAKECVEEEIALLTEHGYKHLLDAVNKPSAFGGVRFYLMQLIERPSLITVGELLNVAENTRTEDTLKRGAEFLLKEFGKRGYPISALVQTEPAELQRVAKEIYGSTFTRRYQIKQPS